MIPPVTNRTRYAGTPVDDLRKDKISDFTAWAAAHITGDEKGEAQIFLDRLFQAFGQRGIKEAGAALEKRVKKADAGGTAFADLVWRASSSSR